MTSMPVSVYVLIAANLLPLFMAGAGDWGLREILPLYWFESAIIGFFNIPRILMASKPDARAAKKGERKAWGFTRAPSPSEPIGVRVVIAVFLFCSSAWPCIYMG